MFARFERAIDATATPEGVTPPAGTLAFFWHFVRQVKGLFFLLVVAQFGIALLDSLLPVFVGVLVQRMTTHAPAVFLEENWRILAAMAGIVLVGTPSLVTLQNLITHQALAPSFSNMVRWQSHWHVVRQSWPFFQADFAGRIANKVMQVGYSLRSAVTTTTNIVFYIGVYGTSAVIALAAIDWRLALPIIVWLTLYILVLRWFVPRIGQRSMEMSHARSMVTGRIVDSYTNILTVKLFARARDEDAYVREGIDDHTALAIRQNRMITQFASTLVFLNAALLTTMAATSISLWSDGAISVGGVATALPFALRLVNMAGWLAFELTEVFENVGTVQESMEVIARPIDLVDAPGARDLVVTAGGVTFDHVTFGYGQRLAVLDDVSIAIRPGEKVGLIGRSGAGKSTLVNLLLRFYDAESGRILIDGQDIGAMTQESLRGAIAMVTQDTSLLHRSIADNIRYGRPDATDTEVRAAAERAHATAFIEGLVDWKGRTGFDAHVGERGVKLSGGQRQRVAIARVILKDAPILVLDEATSALDSEVEAAIQESLADLMEGKTVIAIAHRLSTLQIMDRLIVLDEGRVAESGTHHELLARKGLYADLWARQSGGFLIEPRALDGARASARAAE